MITLQRRFWTATFTLLLGAGCFAACSSENPAEDKCIAGDNIFCRCVGGKPGTKLCLEDGNSFGPCETDRGPCTEAEDDTTSGGEGGQDLPGDGPKPQPGELLAACANDSECETGNCPMGFCTKGCETYEECAPPAPAEAGDCVTFPGVSLGGAGICVPYCRDQEDCDAYGQASVCSFTEEALPTFPVVVCGNWPEVDLPPDDYPPAGYICTDDVVCNLGLDGTGRICDAAGKCADGCNGPEDCPMGVMCTAGQCGGVPPNTGDDCPGITIDLNMGQTMMVAADTSAMPAPGEHNGENGGTGQNCSFSANAEEIVYAVTNTSTQNGYLTVDLSLSSSSSYDPAVYIRAGTCASGTQLTCSDEIGAGVGEIVQTYVFANETVWVFVDGYQSAGASNLTFDLALTM